MTNHPTAYIALQGARVSLDGGVLRIEHPDHAFGTLQLGHVGGLVLLGAVEMTTAAMRGLAERGIACVLASRSARVQAVIAPWTTAGLSRRAAQYRLEASRTASRGDGPHLTLSRAIVDAKCTAMLDLLAQHQRTHGDVDIAFPIARIRAHRERAICASTIDELRGHEGAAAATYFSTMPALCRGDLTTSKRSRRPPRDPINAAISFGYSLLVCEMTTALLARGLDPALGVLHPPEAGRPSLALDLIEPFRHSVVDRLVLRAANRRELTSADFDSEVVQPADPDDATPAPAVRFSDLGRAKFLRMFQAAMCQSDADAGATTGGRAQVSGALAAYESMLEPLLSEPGLMP